MQGFRAAHVPRRAVSWFYLVALSLVAGAMIALGLLTSWAAFLASGEMAAAYFMAHARGGFWPIVNKGELAVLYCFAFLYLATRGGGRYSVDAALRRR